MTAHWRYVVSRNKLYGANGELVEELYEIRELYYDTDDDTVISWTKERVEPAGDNREELRNDLERMLAAIEMPILDLALDPPALVTTPSTLTPSTAE